MTHDQYYAQLSRTTQAARPTTFQNSTSTSTTSAKGQTFPSTAGKTTAAAYNSASSAAGKAIYNNSATTWAR